VTDQEIILLETKSGRVRRLPMTERIAALLKPLPRVYPWVFTNPRTAGPYTTVAKSLERALKHAGIVTGDVTFHSLRHTALSRMIAAGHSDHTVAAISGHSTTRMLERYVHPTESLRVSALETAAFSVPVDTKRPHEANERARLRAELRSFLGNSGGRREARTRDLRVANAALSQLS
jgi:Phage integrase family